MSRDRDTLVDVALGNIPPDVVIQGGEIVNVLTHEIHRADILIKGERIAAVSDGNGYRLGKNCRLIDATGQIITPGFMDPHFHMESSSITVTELAKYIVPKGVTMVAEDPHEIANVLGMRGIELMFEEGRKAPINFFLRVPGKVPAMDSDIETSGASLSIDETNELLDWPEALCLAGDINPKIIFNKDKSQFDKFDITVGKRMTVSGQSTGLKGKELNAFVAAGPEDSHASRSFDEVWDILRHGLKALITHRPYGWQGKDFAKIAELIRQKDLDTRNLLLCTDDTHANQLLKEGHLEYRMKLAIENGIDPITVIQMVTINVAQFFRISRDFGSIAPGKYADLVSLSDLESLNVDKVFVHGEKVVEDGKLIKNPPRFEYPKWAKETINLKRELTPDDFKISCDQKGKAKVRVIVPGRPKETKTEELNIKDGVILPEPTRNIASIAVVERHKATGNVGTGFVNIPFNAGAFASSVSHDSHNIFVIGVNFDDMALAVNRVALNQGGYVVVKDGEVLDQVEMPIAGLLSEETLETVARKMRSVEHVLYHDLGCTISYRPFYTLNFLCLPNNPNVGLTDKGMISTKEMAPIEVIVS